MGNEQLRTITNEEKIKVAVVGLGGLASSGEVV